MTSPTTLRDAQPKKKSGASFLSNVSIGKRIISICAICITGLVSTGIVNWRVSVDVDSAEQQVGDLKRLSAALTEFRLIAANTRSAFYEYVSKPIEYRATAVERELTSNEIVLSSKLTTLSQSDIIKESRERFRRLLDLQKAQAQKLFEIQKNLGAAAERQNWFGASGGLSATGEIARAGDQFERLSRQIADAAPNAEMSALTTNVVRLRGKEFDYAITLDNGAEGDFIAAADRVGRALGNYKGAEAAALKDAFENYVAKFDAWVKLNHQYSDEIEKMDSFFTLMTTPMSEAGLLIAKQEAEALQKLSDIRKSGDMTMIVSFVLSALIALIGSIIVARSVTSPLAALRRVMGRLAAGEIDLSVPHAKDRDEVGEMARSVVVFLDTAVERQALVAQQMGEVEGRVAKAKAVEQLITDFDRRIGATLASLRDAATKLDGAACGLRDASEEVDKRCAEAGGASNNTSQRVTVVASAADQLVNSIREISEQTSRSSGVAERADKQAEATLEHMSALVQSVEKIGEFTGLIGAIAAQTNLLALNATIEAARAGDAGRGFAVVASEVKNLASQTANATEEISRLIGVVHHSSKESMRAVDTVSTIIADMRHISVALASAMHEQDAGIAEIASSMNVLSDEARIGAHAVDSAEHAARSAANIAQEVGDLAGILGEATGTIDQDVSDFLATVRAA